MKRRSNKQNAKSLSTGWGRRAELAFLQVGAIRQERLTLDAFGALVAKTERRSKPYKKATVNAWFGERGQPKIAAFEAMAALAECNPWWIVWNVGVAPRNVTERATALLERSDPSAVASR